jgi:predicted nucleic acid-binding protein
MTRIEIQGRPKVFADTLFLAGMLISSDPWREACEKAAMALPENVLLVTTESVLSEFLAAASKHGPRVREAAVAVARSFLSDSDAFLVGGRHGGASGDLFDKGLELYAKRLDKRYSLTDCISFVAMREEGIRDALTNDHHFEQEGFNILVR